MTVVWEKVGNIEGPPGPPGTVTTARDAVRPLDAVNKRTMDAAIAEAVAAVRAELGLT